VVADGVAQESLENTKNFSKKRQIDEKLWVKDYNTISHYLNTKKNHFHNFFKHQKLYHFF
jgi:hypothetical protein